jgi:hypothetical protein
MSITSGRDPPVWMELATVSAVGGQLGKEG